MRAWILLGPAEHWNISFNYDPPIWGLTPRWYSTYQQFAADDLFFIHVTSPVAGVVGYGLLADKPVDDKLCWPKERQEGRPIYSLRFTLRDVKIIPRDRWKEDCVKPHLSFYQAAVLELSAEHAAKLQSELNAKGVVPITAMLPGATKPKPIPHPEPDEDEKIHEKIKQIIFDIGQLQQYYAQMEYPLESRRLDVVWKREKDGHPWFAYEVELSGGVEKAIQKLKTAYLKWKSLPRLVIQQNEIEKAESVVKYEDKQFRAVYQTILAPQLEEFHKTKIKFKEQEKALGLGE